VKATRDGRETVEWVITGAALDLGLGVPVKLPPFPIGDARLGMFYRNRLQPVGGCLDLVRKQAKPLRLAGGTELAVTRLELANQGIAATLALTLPPLPGAKEGATVTFDPLVRFPADGKFDWTLAPRALRLPVGRGIPVDLVPPLGGKLSHDRVTGELTVRGRLDGTDLGKLEESVREAIRRNGEAPLYAAAVQLLKGDALRLTTGGYSAVGAVPRAEVERLLEAVKATPGEVRFEAIIVGDGPRTKAVQDAVRVLAEEIDRDPRGWLSGRLGGKNEDRPQVAGVPLRVVVAVGGRRVELAGRMGETGAIGWSLLDDGFTELGRNEETLAGYVRRGLGLPVDLTGNHSPIRVSAANYDPDAEELGCTIVWASSLFDSPLEIPVRIPTAPGKRFDWGEPLRRALAGKEIHLGPALRMKLGDATPGRWPVSITAGDLTASFTLGEREGKLTVVEFDEKAVAAWLGKMLPKELVGEIALGPASVAIDVEVTAKAVRAALVVGIDIPKAGKLEARIDNGGVRLEHFDRVLLGLITRRIESLVPDGFTVSVTPRQTVGALRLFDAVVSREGTPLLALDGVRVESDLPREVERVRYLGGPAVLELTGPGWGARATRLGFALPDGLSADVDLTIEPVGMVKLSNVVLGKDGLRVGRIMPHLAPALVARIPELKAVEFGPFTASFGKPVALPKGVEVPLTLVVPQFGGVVVSFPRARFDLEAGLIPGEPQAKLPDGKDLTAPIQRLLTGALGGVAAPVRVSNLRWEVARLDSVAVIFDAELDLPRVGWKPTRNHRLDRSEFRPGDLGDLAEQLKALAADAALDELATWAKQERIDFGPLAFKNIRVDRPGRSATADAELLGRAAGAVRVAFPEGSPAKVVWEKPEALLEPLRASAEGWLFRLAQDRVRITEPTIGAGGVQVSVGLKLPELDLTDFIDLGTLSIGKDGVRFAGDPRAAEEAVWKKVAAALGGRTLTLAGFPLAVTVEKAVGGPSGVTADLRLKVEGLGEAVAPFSASRSGVLVDLDRLAGELVRRIEERLQKETAGCRVQLHKLQYKPDGIHLALTAQVGLKNPIALDVRIDARGVHGLDLGLVVANALNQLAAELKGQKVTVIDGIEIEVTEVEVVRNPDRVRLGGKGKFGPVTLEVTNVYFDGKSFDLKEAKPTVDASALIGSIDIGDVGKIRPPDVSQLFTNNPSVAVTVELKLLGTLEALITVRAGKGGVSIDLPIGFSTGKGVQVVIPPVFNLTNFKAELAHEYIGGGCDITLLEQTLSHLIKLDCRVRIPIKGEPVFTATGRLVVMSVLPAGNTEARADFGKMRLDLTTRLGVPRVIEVDGKFFLDFKKAELEGSGDLKAFGASLAHAKVWFSTERFGAEAELSLLLSQAKAKIDGKWKPLSDTTLAAEVGFGFYLFGKRVTVAGAKVDASLRPSARLTAVVIGTDITLIEVDLGGITIEKIIDLLLRQPVSLAGFKLLASQGGGGVAHIHVHKGGAMHLTVQDPKTGELLKEVIITEQPDGRAVLVEVGHAKTEKTVVVTDPAKNQRTVVSKLKPGDDLSGGVPPYAVRKTGAIVGAGKPVAGDETLERLPQPPSFVVPR
jgi:hypothetical protein